MRAATSSFDKNNASIENLKSVNKILLKQIEQQSIKVNALKGAVAESNTAYNAAQQVLKKATTEYGENSKEADKARRETEKWEKAINDYSIKLNNAQTNLNKYNAELEDNERQINALSSGTNSLGDALSRNNSSLETANGVLSTLGGGLSTAVSGIGTLASDLVKVSGIDLGTIKKGIESVGKAISSISTASLDAINDAVNVSIDGFKEYAKVLGKIAEKISKYSVKTGAGFESQMSTVQALMGYTDYTDEQMSNMEELEDLAKSLGASTQFTATEVAQGYEKMAMAGWKTKDMLGATSSFIYTTAASGEELATVFDILTDAMTSFGYEVTQTNADKFADVLSATITNSNTDMEMLGEAFKKIGPVANQLNYSIEDIALGLGLLANNGIKGEMAGTALRSGLLSMVNPTDDAQAAMDRLGISLRDEEGNVASFNEVLMNLKQAFGQVSSYAFDAEGNLMEYDEIQDELSGKTDELNALAEAGDIFGKRQTASWLALINSADADYTKLYDAIQGCDGMAQEMASVKIDNLTGDFTILKSAVEGVGLSIYGYVEEPLRNLTQTSSDLISQMRDNVENGLNFSKIDVDITLLIDSIGAQIKDGAPKIISSVLGVSTLLNATIRSIADAAIKVIPEFIGYGLPTLIDNYWLLVNTLIEQISASAPTLVESGSKVISSFMDGITATSINVGEVFPDFVRTLGDGLKNVLPNVLDMGTTVLKTIANGAVAALPEVLSIGQLALEYITQSLADAPEKLSNFLDSILRTGLAGDLTSIMSTISELVSTIIATLSNGDVISQFKTVANVVGGALISGINDVVPQVVAFLPTLVDDFIQPLLDLLTNGDLLTNVGTAISDLLTLIIDFLGQNTGPFISGLLQVITAIIYSLSDNADIIIPAFSEIISGILVGVADNIDALLDSLIELIGEVAIALTSPEVLVPLLDGLTTLVSKTLFALCDVLPTLGKAIGDVIVAILQIVANPQNLGAILETVTEILSSVFLAIPTLLSGLVGMLPGIVRAFSDWIMSTDWGSIGKEILNGIVGGLNDALDYAGDAISNISGKVVDFFKRAFDIHSPSKLMADKIGKYLLPGITEGVEDTLPQAANNIQQSINGLMSRVSVDSSIGTITKNLSVDSNVLSANDMTPLIRASGNDIIRSETTQNIDNSTTKSTKTSFNSLFEGATINVTINNDDDIETIAQKLKDYMQRDEMGVGVA